MALLEQYSNFNADNVVKLLDTRCYSNESRAAENQPSINTRVGYSLRLIPHCPRFIGVTTFTGAIMSDYSVEEVEKLLSSYLFSALVFFLVEILAALVQM